MISARPVAPSRRWAFFGLAAVSILMAAIDATIVAVALPTLVRDLDTTLVWAGWTITAYALVQTIMMPIAGKLAERLGQLRVFLACVVLFTLGSLLCGLAPNVYALIACRVLQALGGGGFFPAATGIVAQQFPETRSRMLGLFASIFPIGGILGPNLGGLVIEQIGWRATFLINVPIGLLVIALLARYARAPLPAARAAGRPVDWRGSALFAVTVVTFLTALTLLGDDPDLVRSPLFWAMVAGGAVALLAFVAQERRAADPIVDLALVVRHPFGVVNLFGILSGACFMGFFSFIPYYVTVQYGFSPSEAGAVLTPRSLVMIAVSAGTSFLLARIGYRRPMLLGLLCVIGALLALGRDFTGLTLGSLQLGPLVPLLLIMALSGFGMGTLIPAANNAGIDLLPSRAAQIAGIRGLFNNTGGIIGTAIIVLWLELSPDKAAGMRDVFTVLGLLLLVTAPLVLLIPDTARARLKSGSRSDVQDAAEVAPSRRTASPAVRADG